MYPWYVRSDYYAILGVHPDASLAEVRTAYRQAARLHHPDRGGTHARMKAINEAYEVLRDPGLRADFDEGWARAATGQVPRRQEQRPQAPTVPTQRPSPTWPLWISAGLLLMAVLLWLGWGYQSWQARGWDFVGFLLLSEFYWVAVLWIWSKVTTIVEALVDWIG